MWIPILISENSTRCGPLQVSPEAFRIICCGTPRSVGATHLGFRRRHASAPDNHGIIGALAFKRAGIAFQKRLCSQAKSWSFRWSFRQLKFAFLNEQSRSNVLARLNQVHGFCRRVQAEDVFVRFMDGFDSKYFLLADSLYAVF
jgi:hypothetical protein